MANTFGILTALVLAFSAFVAYKNKQEFELQKDETAIKQRNFETLSGKYGDLVADVTDLDQKTKDANESRDGLQAQLDEQNNINDDLDKTIAQKQSDLDQVTGSVANAEDKLKELGRLDELAPRIERLNAEIADLQDEVTTLNTEIDRLKGEKSRTNEALASAKTKQTNINAGRSLSSMETKIASIDRRLGFVTLADGIDAGVVGNSKVAVIRNGEKIGELSVTAVSANAATADILHSTIKEGMDVAIGDKVVPVQGAAEPAS